MSRVHVFAIDWVPGRAEVASGGGLRSLQIVEALRDGGHEVTVSVPRGTPATQRLDVIDPARARPLLRHDATNQADILRETRPSAAVWLWPSERNVVFGDGGDMVHVCDLNGLQDFEMAGGAARRLPSARRRLRESCARADLILTGSDEQHGYWLASLADPDRPISPGHGGPSHGGPSHGGPSHGGPGLGAPGLGAPPPMVVVPFALPRAMRSPGATEASALRKIHFVGSLFSWNASLPRLATVANWVARRPTIQLSVICAVDAALGTTLGDFEAIRALEAMERVEILEHVPFGAAMDKYGPGSLHLDLYDTSIERLLAVPIRAVNALTHGVPALCNVASGLSRRIVAAGAGLLTAERDSDTIEQALDRLASLPAKSYAAMAAAARGLAEDVFSPEQAGQTLCDALAAAADRRVRRVRGWRAGARAEPPLGNVLVFSSEDGNLRELRVDLPFSAMRRQRLIAGYNVWNNGRLVGATRDNPACQTYDAIWIQRSASGELALTMDALGLPFVYDIDDLLVVSPAYRPPFAPETVQAVRGFLRAAHVLSCCNGRLARHLQTHVSAPLLHKTVLTPNLLRAPPLPRPAGEPTCVVWSSSDIPALTTSRTDVLRAVRDFCLTYGLRLLCIGSPPPDAILGDGVVVEHMPAVGYSSYLDTLRASAPAILVCPLETSGDENTQQFVDSKSDIKMLEALGTGLVGVMSAARPYLETDLPGSIVTLNDYRGWFAALRAARDACLRGAAPEEVPPAPRLAAQGGLMPWFEALRAARLDRALALAEINDVLAMIRGRVGRRRLGPDEFDSEFYLGRHADVRRAIEDGKVASGYQHYLSDGYAEGRAGRADDNAAANGEQLWANIFHTIGDARQAIENRTQGIEELKRRRDIRLRLRRAAL